MSRPIAYNTSFPLSGSITTQQGGGLISYTIDGTGRDYSSFAGKKWVPSADGAGPIIFVTDSFTQGISTAANAVPLFYVCNGTSSAAIVYTANHLPGSPGNYTTAEDAITDLLSNDWFIIEGEQPFEGVNADKMVLDLDPSKLISYPGTGTVWYDISGKNNPSNLTNGPTFNSGGWFEFDGIDDYSVGQGGLVGPDCTIELWISSSNYNGKIPLSIDGNGYASGPNLYFTNNLITWNTGDGAGNPFVNSSYPDTKWHHIMVSNDQTGAAGFGQAALYIDGDFVGFANPLVATATQSANRFWIGRFHGGSYFTSGKFKAARIYDEAFTEARIKQNYFGSNIVTDGLIFAVDANNIVSYPKSGTTWYTLTGSIASGTLTNGPTFNQANGGVIEFDGTNDYVNYSNNINPTSSFSCEAWINFSNIDLPAADTAFLAKWTSASSPQQSFIFGYREAGGQKGISFYLYNSSYTIQGNYAVNWDPIPNRWYHVVGVYSASNFVKIYVDGVEDFSRTSGVYSSLNPDSTQNITSGVAPGLSYFPGKIANAKIYNKALSASEVLQNYQAEQYRFAGPQGIPTNGLQLWLDASNLDSYPGSGTTWYDLSSQGNHMNLVNGPTYNQTNGGEIIFDGIDDYAQRTLSSCSTSFKTMTEYTIVSVFQSLDPTTAWNCLWGFGDGDGNVDNWQRTGTRYFGSDNQSLYTTVDLYTAGINMWAQTFTSGDNKIYRNNTLNTSNAATTITNPSTAAGFVIANNSNSFGYPTKMNMNLMLIYNRVLTTTELTQIYNYYKGRFGL